MVKFSLQACESRPVMVLDRPLQWLTYVQIFIFHIFYMDMVQFSLQASSGLTGGPRSSSTVVHISLDIYVSPFLYGYGLVLVTSVFRVDRWSQIVLYSGHTTQYRDHFPTLLIDRQICFLKSTNRGLVVYSVSLSNEEVQPFAVVRAKATRCPYQTEASRAALYRTLNR